MSGPAHLVCHDLRIHVNTTLLNRYAFQEATDHAPPTSGGR